MLLHSSRLPPPRALAGRRLPLGGCARLCAPAVLPSALQPPQHRPSRRDALCSLAVLGAGAASARGARASAFASEVEAATAAAEAAFTPPTRVTAPGRVVAIGDLHGDMAQALRALALAGVVGLDPDGSNRAVWTGGNTTLVQLGDILDRGDEEIGEPRLGVEYGQAAVLCRR